MNTLKYVWFALALAGGAMSLAATSAARAADPEEEIAIQGVYLPQNGYDDNDHIVMVAAGELPSVCQTLGATRLERQGNVIRVHQYAWVRKTGFCGTGDVDPDLTAPFDTEVSLGQLDAGDYVIQFRRPDGTVASRPFTVSKAETAGIDDYPYANVSNVLTPAVAIAGDPISVTLQGTLTATCETLEEPRLERQGDVFVVLPILTRALGTPCRRARSEFRNTIQLGALKAGNYLVHVRAMNGKAVNRMLYVLPRY